MDGHCSFLGRLMVRRRAVLCYHVKFVGVFWIFSSRMTQMGGDVVLSHIVFLVFMTIVLMSRCHCRLSMVVMIVVVMLMFTTLFSPVLEP